MSFWKFCEKVSGCVGERLVIQHIQEVRTCYMAHWTVLYVADKLKNIVKEAK